MAEKKRLYFSILFFIFVPLIIFVITDVPFVFYNNDDFFLKQIASGELTGTPEAHLLHIGYPTGIVLSTLYKIFPSVPWYGILLFSYGYLGIILTLHAIRLRFEKKITGFIGSVLLVFITFAFSIVHLVNIQFTTITTIVCAASLVSFYLAEETEDVKVFLTKNIPGLVLFILSLELRNSACIMLLPSFLLLILVKWLRNRKLTKSLLAYGSILLCLVILSFCIEKIAYSGNQWSIFKDYNTARANMMDYDGFPDYDAFKDEYDALGITQQSYVSATTHYQLLLDDNIDANALQTLDNLVSNPDIDIKALFKAYLERHTVSYLDRPLNMIVYALYFFAILFIIISKKYKILWDVAALFCGRNIVWIYLLLIGRSPTRVTQGVYIMELLLLLAIIVSNQLYCDFLRNKKTLRYFICGTFIACSLFIAIKWGIPNTAVVTDYSRNQLAYSDAYEEVREYMYENGQNLYLLDTQSFSYFTENIFSKTPESSGNFMLMGSWTANSPWSDSVLAKYGYTAYEQAVTDGNNVYFIFMNSPQIEYDYLNDYFNEKQPGNLLCITDTIHCTNGLEFIVLQLQPQ